MVRNPNGRNDRKDSAVCRNSRCRRTAHRQIRPVLPYRDAPCFIQESVGRDLIECSRMRSTHIPEHADNLMSLAYLTRLDLRRLILLLVISTALIMLANSFHASYRVQHQLLIDNAQETNRTYALKLAESTEDFLQSTQQQLGYSAGVLAEHFDNDSVLQEEAQRLRLQTDSFNSVLITDAQGWVRATSPETLQVKGQQLKSPGALQALRERRPLISRPYTSSAGNLLVFISHPIVTRSGRYLGYVGGTIYLKQKSMLNNLLGEHYHRDGSYLYVVDQNRLLLYHPDPSRIGTVVGKNAAIDAVLRGENGSQRIRNSRGEDMLAGYATLPSAGWGVVAQRPTTASIKPLDGLMLGVLRNTLPIAILTLLCVWWLARLITRPLWMLAREAREMNAPEASDRIQRIRSWYFEAAQIKRAMLVGIGLLQHKIGKLNLDVQTDPMTGLHNRRGLALALETWQAELRPFAVVALDIDHFKRINDSHGHAAGDQVIQQLAQLMRSGSRDVDVLCRSGGEEFLMLLPDASPAAALKIAERLRQRVEHADMPGVGAITISLGVAHWPLDADIMEQVLEIADAALYKAKQGGRNRVVVVK